MKKAYNNPTVEIIKFEAEDIITTSNETIGIGGDGKPVDEYGNPL